MMKLSLTEDGIPDFLLLIGTADGQEVARLHLVKDDFNAPMEVTIHPRIVTSIRIAAGLVTTSPDNWTAAATFLAGIEDAAAFAASLGYNLQDWLS